MDTGLSLFVYVGDNGWVYYARDPGRPSRIPHDMYAGIKLRSATDAVVFAGFQEREVRELFRSLRGHVPDAVRVRDADFSVCLGFDEFLAAVRERDAREFSCLADASDACVADMERRGVLVHDVGSDEEWFRRWYSTEQLRRLFDEIRPRWPDEQRAVGLPLGGPFTSADIEMEYNDDDGKNAFDLGDEADGGGGGEKLHLSIREEVVPDVASETEPVPDVGSETEPVPDVGSETEPVPDLFVGVSSDGAWVYLAWDPKRPRRIARHMHAGRWLRRIRCRIVFGEGQDEAVDGLFGCLRGEGPGMSCVRDLHHEARVSFGVFSAAVKMREAKSFPSSAVTSLACVADMERRGVVVRSVGTDPEWFRPLYSDEDLDRLCHEMRPRWPDEKRAVATTGGPFTIEDFQTQYDDNCRKIFDCVEDDGCHFVFNEQNLYLIINKKNK